jgi:hypothetical protein
MIALHEAMSRRLDGDWELLATSANVPESVALTSRMLSRRTLGLGSGGKTRGQRHIRRRVEALAVNNPALLAELAREWRTPTEFPTEGDGYFIPAWRQSLRHLQKLGAIVRSEVDVPALADEVEVLFDAVTEPETPALQIYKARRWAKRRLLESSVTFHKVCFRPAMLRVLRGREQLLDAAGRTMVAELCTQKLFTYDPYEMGVALEFCRVVLPDIFHSARALVAERIASSGIDPNAVIPLAYVLLDTGWTTP